MDKAKLQKQQYRLAKIPEREWREVLNALTRHMTRKLGAALIRGLHNEELLVGGRTSSGAHSEPTLKMNALYYYQEKAVEKLYSGERKWREDLSLLDQLIDIVDNLMEKQVEKWKRQQKRTAGRPPDVEVEVETLPENEQPSDEADVRTEQLQLVWRAVEGDKELETFVETLGRHSTMEEVRKHLGLSKADVDKLRKRVIRRTNKIKHK